jgi:sec-independent protein translocase protein TatA
MFSRIGPWEIILILVIVLIIFGAGKLPQVGSAIGKGLRSFKKGASGDESEEEEDAKSETVSRTSTRKRSTAKKA